MSAKPESEERPESEEETSSPESPKGGTFVGHLIELRDRLLRIVLVMLVLFVAMVPFANDLFNFFAEPLMSALPEGATLINTRPADIILVPFKLVLLLALVLALPYILHQIWGFIAPGLYHNEKRIATPLLVSSVLLFYAGMAFAFFVVLRLIFRFFVAFAPESVAVTTDIGPYFDFVFMMFLAFGIAFEVPIAAVLLVIAGAVTPDQLAKARPYLIVGAFTIGMVLTPPDIISQTLLALPMWILFEAGLLFSRMIVRRRERDAEHDEDDEFDEDFEPMSEDQMDAELDRIEGEEQRSIHPPDDGPDPTRPPSGG
jgi:sec-independent protein translocase protein TatC